MSVIEIAERLRTRTFRAVAEFAAEQGYAVGAPDETGRPRILASVRPITECRGCGLRPPEDHTCTNPQETPNG